MSEILSSEGKGTIRRVAVYCRVSTATEMQEGSFAMQKAAYTRQIAESPEMELVEIYGDYGKSGRFVQTRPEFQRMIRDCEAGKIDVILTKSISRFARNLADCMENIQKLRHMGIPVIFEENHMNTMDSSSELLLCILASIAQEESNSISQNILWAYEQRNARGETSCRISYGYRREDGGSGWRVEPSEAMRVRYAFEKASVCTCYREILQGLNAMEEQEQTGVKWSRKRLGYLLSNVCYIGDYLTGKSYRAGGHKQRKNKGERDQYYLEGHHEAIVDRAMFQRVQQVKSAGLLHSYRVNFTEEEKAIMADANWKRSKAIKADVNWKRSKAVGDEKAVKQGGI